MDLVEKKIRFSPIGYTKYLKGLKKSHSMFREGEILESLAIKSWQIAPGNTTISPKAFFLEGQLERITGTAYTNDPVKEMHGGFMIQHAETRAYQLKNIWMINGFIYKGLHNFRLHPTFQISKKMNYFPRVVMDAEIDNAALYSTSEGNQYFGLWLTDDCANYTLAAAEGTPVTSNIIPYSHMPEYESFLGMNPFRTNSAYLKNAIFFDDNWGNNENKHLRFAANRNKLLTRFPSNPHPGVFILRRNSGISRVMLNEIEIAEKLRDQYGFKIVDVTQNSASEILAACAGAKILAGIEGSHLFHGLMMLEPNASVLIFQPPTRFSAVIKNTTDMEGIHYSFVVGIQKEENFYIDFEEVKRTLELIPS
ncbi:glycosyltransferase family 61 protein [Flavobacterium sp. 17A]|uniref:Glycosyltransferase family 61 protein n=1 Tax=Flavobacterium potami TaxID=2872310 RepID=A0A9X1HBM6_9FLAO|nr:glycosyltransferase family 61 protein [Flavobacterium potami]MBZ4036344.1 glycosyltransferase family 61 protein [Flavobacterium potami]